MQLTPDFAFAEVVGILDHLVDLGVSHLYLSPILEAMPGSTHGYDWSPPCRVSTGLGGLDGYRLLRAHARAVGIGIILDIVPNHVGVADARHNPWWADVLRNGADSAYAHYFDLDLHFGDGALCLPWLDADGDLSSLRLDDDGNLVLHERVLSTAEGTSHAGDDPAVVLGRQRYRLVPFTSMQIGYRRFLAVNDLAALRQEADDVFDATHAWLADLVADDLVDGVRVDHLDGLTDPIGYCRRLRAVIGERLLYVEKGLSVGERLDPALVVDGTTGYDALRVIEGAYTAASGTIELSETYQRITGVSGDGDELTARANDLRHVTLIDLFSDRVRRTTELFAAAAPDVPVHNLQQAVTTFICDDRLARPDYPALVDDVVAAIGRLRADNPSMSGALDVVADAFVHRDRAPEAIARLSEAIVAVTAKAFEDIGYHRTSRLVSTNELGCTPAVPSVNRTEFHTMFADRDAHWPRSLNALSTHDTKRSEDVRARIAVIAQTPQRWSVLVLTLWGVVPPPDDRTAYFLLQNVIGVWPQGSAPDDELRERLAGYARKVMREAGRISSWSTVDEAAESSIIDWLETLYVGLPADLIGAFVDVIADAGHDEAIARKVLSLTLPGVGDLYQGTQWWTDSLTDPDNRRPVRYTQPTDHPKLDAVRTALAVRRRSPEAFGSRGGYTDIRTKGANSTHVIAFSRDVDGEARAVVVAVRLAHTFRTHAAREDAVVPLPPGLWRDAVTGRDHEGRVTSAEILGDAPYALLELL
ncbi:putative maltooligosyl trehalose synthase [Gordonia spumicola]|uniref:Putative maltooligosyl trehalose synthase n=1 Tax=Gordonia spumicola TaxID=589161 RepID=A0A7I9VDL1_9ACTN|nr:putative maltooligosyl trehalose synthase [Gordonia spumicola]